LNFIERNEKKKKFLKFFSEGFSRRERWLKTKRIILMRNEPFLCFVQTFYLWYLLLFFFFSHFVSSSAISSNIFLLKKILLTPVNNWKISFHWTWKKEKNWIVVVWDGTFLQLLKWIFLVFYSRAFSNRSLWLKNFSQTLLKFH
jgi:hypothetical protein